ncbi:MAG: hypothetical protein H6812_04330 [Phycisphaeraceae bacterium]|nr:hypothetical protein [Phycisphaerales bacterium]MCB9842465.1 hypothetical protein [Phycisphaeraceae bacterium]
MKKSLLSSAVLLLGTALFGCAQTVTTPGNVAGVRAVDIEGLAGEWRSEEDGVTNFVIRRVGPAQYLISNHTPGYEGEQMDLFAFRVNDNVIVESASRDPEGTEDPTFNYMVYEVNGNVLRVMGGNGSFPDDWSHKGILLPDGPQSELPVPPDKRAEILDAMFEYVRSIWPDDAPGRFVRVK